MSDQAVNVAAAGGNSPANEDELARLREQFLASERAARAEFDKRFNSGEMSDLAINIRKKEVAKKKSEAPVGNPGQAYLLWALLGPVSGHRFYLRAYVSAFLQALCFALGVACLWQAGYDNQPMIVGGFMLLMVFGWSWTMDAFAIPRLSRKRAAGEDMRLKFI